MPAASTSGRFRSPSLLLRIAVGAGMLLGILFLLMVLVVTAGHVDGYEFSPQSFEHREFTYYRLPWIRLQVSPVFRDTKTSPQVVQELKTAKKWPVTSAPLQWEVVERRPQQDLGDASIVRQYLELDDPLTNTKVWTQWNEQHPQLVDLFWRAITTLTRDRLFAPTTDLFELALDTPPKAEPEDFEHRLTQSAIDAYELALAAGLQPTAPLQQRLDQLRSTGWSAVDD